MKPKAAPDCQFAEPKEVRHVVYSTTWVPHITYASVPKTYNLVKEDEGCVKEDMCVKNVANVVNKVLAGCEGPLAKEEFKLDGQVLEANMEADAELEIQHEEVKELVPMDFVHATVVDCAQVVCHRLVDGRG